jgi:hypothetical protein
MKFCFVPPRYFDGIAGGAETLMGGLAHALQSRGDSVEILTTCAKDNRTWANEFEAGESVVNGIKVTRFEVDERDLERWIPIQCALHEGSQVSADDQITWMAESVNSKAMYAHIARRAHEFDAIFFGPYLFGTTFWGSLIAPEKSILIPCLHDESYAYQEVIASMFRQVRGCLFNAEPEMYLARSLYGDIRGGVVGMGFEMPSTQSVESLPPYFESRFPYILYLGRKETGKNVHRLIDYFCSAKSDGLIRWRELLGSASPRGGESRRRDRSTAPERGGETTPLEICALPVSALDERIVLDRPHGGVDGRNSGCCARRVSRNSAPRRQ